MSPPIKLTMKITGFQWALNPNSSTVHGMIVLENQ